MKDPNDAQLYREYWQHPTAKVQQIYDLFRPLVEQTNRQCRVIRKLLAFRKAMATGSGLLLAGGPRMSRKDMLVFRQLSLYDSDTLERLFAQLVVRRRQAVKRCRTLVHVLADRARDNHQKPAEQFVYPEPIVLGTVMLGGAAQKK